MFTKDYAKMAEEQVSAYLKKYIPDGKVVLDVGAGIGYFNGIFRWKFERICALDMGLPKKDRKEPETFEEKQVLNWEDWFAANDADEKVEFDLDSGKPFPFADNSFDFVFSSNVIEHLNNRENYERETLRILKPGGYAMIITPKRKCLVSYYDRLFKGGYNGWDTDHVHLYQPNELVSELEEAGFDDVRKFPCGILFYYVPYIAALEPFNMGFLVIAKKKGE